MVLSRLAAGWSAIRQLSTGKADFKLPLAFVFDIDGVLIRGGAVLPQAREAMHILYQGADRPHFPLCFLTNGGGVTETTKAAELSHWLRVPVHESQVVLSHTPFRQLAEQYSQRPVLVAGRKQTADVALNYGFESAVTTCELAAAFPHSVPFSLSVDGQAKPELPREGIGTADKPIEAVMLFTDPKEWYLDLQIIHDIITSGGVMGRPPSQEHLGRVRLLFSNPDLLWSNEHPTGRFGQGAFRSALEALHSEVIGAPLANYKVYGKPNPEPYVLVEELLAKQAGLQQESTFGTIVAIGDNPKSDIAGATAAGRPWVSALVRTGVFQGGDNDRQHPADLVVEDVLQAVTTALDACKAS
ncbi:hypothetical protein WJX73_010022 [Symbiochloris irregularis]|uniref:Uncharacterized protein n=1 Tax=Symbiochloris irregularis TaxID=706552 RepID=A0AAW1PYS9_9CHLO